MEWRNSEGQFHREDGPAVIWPDGEEEWLVDGNEITNEVNEWIAENSLRHWKEWSMEEKTLFILRFR